MRNVGSFFSVTNSSSGGSTNAQDQQNQANTLLRQHLQLLSAKHLHSLHRQRLLDHLPWAEVLSQTQNQLQLMHLNVKSVGERFLGTNFTCAGSTSVSLLKQLMLQITHGDSLSPLQLQTTCASGGQCLWPEPKIHQLSIQANWK